MKGNRHNYEKQQKGNRAKARQSKQREHDEKPIRSSGAIIWLIIFFGGILWALH